MNTQSTPLKAWRVASQKLGARRCRQPVDAVKHLAGIQAQDYRWGRWSIGLRTGGSTEGDVEQAIEAREIVRTWMFRGTLHFVAAADLPWFTALLAPGIIRGNARRYRQLGLDDTTFAQSQDVIRHALARHGALTRAELAAALGEEGLPAQGQQVPYLLQRAALDGLICHGLQRGAEPEYVLVSDWIGTQPATGTEEDLGHLAARYLAGHGPATRHDFAWWAGLSMSDARQGLEAAPGARTMEAGGIEYWVVGAPPDSATADSASLLPRFDEYLLGYKERALVLDPAYTKKVNPGGGMPKPTVMIDGEIAGTWSYVIKKQEIAIDVASFQPLTPGQRTAVDRAAADLSRYTGLSVKMGP